MSVLNKKRRNSTGEVSTVKTKFLSSYNFITFYYRNCYVSLLLYLLTCDYTSLQIHIYHWFECLGMNVWTVVPVRNVKMRKQIIT